jgi:hypothetical protein
MSNQILLFITDLKSEKVFLVEANDKEKQKTQGLKTSIKEKENSLNAVQRAFNDVSCENRVTFRHLGNSVNKNNEVVHIFSVKADENHFKIKSNMSWYNIKDLHREFLSNKLEHGVWEALSTEGMLKALKKPQQIQKFGI